ncbi:MAG: tRNA pseudouridine(38-40) synthase TruA, partial [Alphaproteobacteria bacterium]|nr:tRNA pseudouridine(38-40) synthase TruA [Alphaproteobacteria bacterium]
MTERYRLVIEYDGGPFVGWQRQDNGPSVQGVIEDAVYRFCGERVTLFAAGRTDAGVHALGQVAHCDLAKATTPDKLRDAVNAHLRPAPVSILKAELAAPEFHARFDAIKRAYRYVILDRRAPPAVMRGRVWHVRRELDAHAMQDAAQHLVGRHDFTTFRAAECQAASPVRTLDLLQVRRDGETIVIEAEARSFLHHQIRSITGSLKLVGDRKWEPERMAQILAARDRSA